MSVIFSPMFDILTGDVAVCDNVLYNYLFMFLVGEFAFRLTYSRVGNAYRSGAIGERVSGSILHWVIRIVVYVILAYALRAGIWTYNFVIGIPPWVWLVLLTVCLLVFATALYVIVISKREATIKNRLPQKEPRHGC